MIGTPVCLTGNPSFVVASAQITSVTRSRILELIGEATPQSRQQLAANSVLPAQTSPASGSGGGSGRFRGTWLRNSPATDADIKAGRAAYRGDRVFLRLPPGVQAQLDKGTRRYSTPLDEHLARTGAEIPDVSWPGGGLPMPPGNAPHRHWRDYAVRRGWTRTMRAV